MQVTVAIDARFDRTPDGDVWTDGWARHSFWQRYLMVFDEVRVLARVRDVQSVPDTFVRCTGPAVRFVRIPHYLGPWQYARRYFQVRSAVKQAIAKSEGIVLRAPGTVANLAETFLRSRKQPYGIEVVGDPREVFSPGGVRTVLRPILRISFARALRRQCRGACAASYVTSSTLQKRYPAGPEAFATWYSSIDMPDEAFVDVPRLIGKIDRPMRVAFVGSLGHLYKGPDVLIEAVAVAAKQGCELQLTIVGDGKHRSDMEALAARLGVTNRVCFVGSLPSGRAVRDELDQSHLFVLPSRAEGLPRALIEAMARALPCISTRIGGIPELLSASELVPAGDARALAAKMCEIADDPQRQARLSAENLQRARAYHVGELTPRRRAFYQAVHEASHARQRGCGTAGLMLRT